MTTTTLEEIAPPFTAMAHSIGVAVAATVGRDGTPRTRPVQPVWEWADGALVGWMTTEAGAPKVAELERVPTVSLTYWTPAQDTCTADCAVERVADEAERVATWERFATAPDAARYDLSTHPAWDGPTDPVFAVFRLRPVRLQLVDGTLMTAGEGRHLRWSAARPAEGARES